MKRDFLPRQALDRWLRCQPGGRRRGGAGATVVFAAVWCALMSWFFPVAVQAQRPGEVVLHATKTAYQRTDLLLGLFDVLSGGADAVATADMLQEVIFQDLGYSGFFRVGLSESDADTDSLVYEFTIEGTVEGPLRDAAATGERAPVTISLKLLSYPERQLILTKRYRPSAEQERVTAHHFANQVIEMLAGSPGICLTRICFSRGSGDRRDLYVIDYDGENLLRVTANRTLNLCPSWSPDGMQVAFTSYRRGQQALFALDTRTGKVRQVIAVAGLNLGADWHPDGDELVLSLSHSGSPEIYRISPQGELLHRLTVSPAIEISPCWDPAGRDIVFTSDRTGTPQLYIMDSDGAGRRRLTFEGRYNDSAMWSPNGENIVYACRQGNVTQLVLIAVTGENRRVLTDRSWRNSEDPSWAPDGRHIVFASDRTGVFKLYVMDVVDGDWRQLTAGGDPDITPDWSP